MTHYQPPGPGTPCDTPNGERDGLAEVVAMQADLIAQLQADNLTLARYVRQGHDYPGMLKALERIFGK